MKRSLHERNRRIYRLRSVAAEYGEAEALLPPEAAILAECAAELRGAALLDIGVGTGRTTLHWRGLCRRYVGIDLSPAMLAIARVRFPGAAFLAMDAADLTAFASRGFDVVLFSFNGIDAAPDRERQEILQGIGRVLRPGGLFIFSSHNRGTRIEAPYELSNFRGAARPGHFLSRLGRYLAGNVHALRTRRYEIETPEYALRVDNASEYRLVHSRGTSRATGETRFPLPARGGHERRRARDQRRTAHRPLALLPRSQARLIVNQTAKCPERRPSRRRSNRRLAGGESRRRRRRRRSVL
jgi:SAM-dependent methyltransferase